MSLWGARKARVVLAALLRIGWRIKRQSGSHKVLSRESWADFIFAFHESDEIGPRMLARIVDTPACVPKISEPNKAPEPTTCFVRLPWTAGLLSIGLHD